MNLTRQDILQHGKIVPWPNDLQVEQDLLLSGAMVAIFSDDFLKSHIAMRGGTVLHKIHLAPPARYSEDIDLVAVTDRNETHLEAGLKRVLRPILGDRTDSAWEKGVVKVRNLFSPSKIRRITYTVSSVSTPNRSMSIKIEINVSERTTLLPIVKLPFTVPFQGQALKAEIASFDINEMMGTKLRALFQRDAGRDLFDLFHARTGAGFDAARTIEAFNHYMAGERKYVKRADFDDSFDERMKNPAFRTDMETLLRSDLDYDVDEAAAWVRTNLLNRLPA